MAMTPDSIQILVAAWQDFLNTSDWQKLIRNAAPKPSGCGLVYELPNYLNRPEESFTIADMRALDFAEPHYHPTDNYEIYLVLQGEAVVVVGGEEQKVKTGDVVVIPPDTAHFTIPDKNFVIAAVNTPPFKPENYIKLTETESNPAFRFDAEQFNRILGE